MRWQKIHITALWVLLSLTALSTLVILVRVNRAQAQAHEVLCTARHDAKVGLRGSVQFLHDHPNGTADFSKSFILNAIHQDQQKARSFAGLTCS